MWQFLDSSKRHAGGVSRRQALIAGAFSCGGFTLADLLRAEQAAGIGKSSKAIVNIHLDGGPPQMDLIDPKPLAPVEIRGEFAPIATRVPGIDICELLPQMAAMADKYVFIRSLVGSVGVHDAFQCQSGYSAKDLASLGGRPALGSVVARMHGSTRDVAPPFVDLMQGRGLVRNSARPGFLGPAFQPFRPDIDKMFSRPLEEAMKNELAAKGTEHVTSLALIDGLSLDRLSERTSLAAEFDRLRREVDASGMMQAMDGFTQQAVSILTSGQFAAALDFEREDPRVVARYTPPASDEPASRTSEGAAWPKKLLLARRLIEAGVRVVSVSLSDFDTHTANFDRLRKLLPVFDFGLAAFIADLEDRRMLDDVTIVAWGEFGRTPKVNSRSAGRDHWPAVGMALLAGGGLQTGQVIGQTDRTASVAIRRPVSYQDVFATLYQRLGIDLASARLADPTGRPQMLLDTGQPLYEAVGRRAVPASLMS